MARLRSGYCLVPNPWNHKQISRVSLAVNDVDAIVFWSKNPAPLIPYVPEIDRLGFQYYFLFTINDYPDDIEHHLPPVTERIGTFCELSSEIGKGRMVWRYDPVIVSRRFDAGFHMRTFENLARQLSGATARVIISIADFYARTERRLSDVEAATGDRFARDPFALPEFGRMIESMAASAAASGMSIQSCAEDNRLEALGIKPGKCIDDVLLMSILNHRVSARRDTGQRQKCLCIESRDIGVNNTCVHGCEYCYATSSRARAERNYESHDPGAPMLYSCPERLEAGSGTGVPEMKTRP